MNMSFDFFEKGRRIWIVGGTGQIGRRVAALLPPKYVTSVVTVSRKVCAPLDQNSLWQRHHQLDLSSPDASLPVRHNDIVINLTEKTRPEMVAKVLEEGAIFVDTSANPSYLRALRLAARATKGQGYLVDCVGLAPGLTNIMANYLADRNFPTKKIEIGVELGVGAHVGVASLEWFYESLSMRYTTKISGKPHEFGVGELRKEFQFSNAGKPRLALGFPFAEQTILADELSGPCTTVQSFLALRPTILTKAVAFLQKAGASRRISQNSRRISRLTQKLLAVDNPPASIVIRGFDRDGFEVEGLRLSTKDQNVATAAVVTATALAAPPAEIVQGSILTCADILSLEQAIKIIRSVEPDVSIERGQKQCFKPLTLTTRRAFSLEDSLKTGAPHEYH